ncbi:MAG: leucyl aminopeptidase family protein [Candidatus Izemoplasmatales bacterium]|jgi:leucyl aminopeptidase|nr:leucyl aminopeptidase family protein [Candidatus Izemoplasmatales bacterium]
MVDIIEQKSFDLMTEEKVLVLTNNLNNSIVNNINQLLNGVIKANQLEEIVTIYTLGKLPADKIVVINHKTLLSRDKCKDLFKKIAEIKSDSCVLLDTFESENQDQLYYDLTETILSKNYTFQLFKSKKDHKDRNFFFYGTSDSYSVIKKAYICAKAQNIAKDLTNTPYNYLNAEKLANEVLKLKQYPQIKVQLFGKSEIEEMNMGLFLGVNKGSLDEPKLIYITYQGKDNFDNPTALIGKGVMYDTGGYSLKTPVSMPGMKVDMAGAASVIAAIEAIAQLELKVNVMGIVAATDNRIGQHAIVPDDILTSAKGLTVEIISTDAEGRLTLADAIWFAQQKNAKEIIDIATLTGAIVSALGDEFTGAFTNSKPFLKEFMDASVIADECIWEMPISSGYHKELKSDFADLKNKGGKNAGASIAAAFLEEFVEKDTSWIHLDIAATSVSNNNASGVMVKSFVEFFYQRSK